jgi:hypothetical protein
MRRVTMGLVAVALLSACRGGGNAGAGGNGGAGGSTGGAGGNGGEGASGVPFVDVALDGACPAGSKPPDNGVSPGTDL